MSQFRVSQISLSLVLLDEYDAPKPSEPIFFMGDAGGSATDKAKAFLDDIEAKLAAAKPAEVVPQPAT